MRLFVEYLNPKMFCPNCSTGLDIEDEFDIEDCQGQAVCPECCEILNICNLSLRNVKD